MSTYGISILFSPYELSRHHDVWLQSDFNIHIIYSFSASYLLKTVDNQRYTQSLAAALITEVLK